MLGSHLNLHYEEGAFSSEMTEVELNTFIEQRLTAYQEIQKRDDHTGNRLG
jgi:hypothetical protein